MDYQEEYVYDAPENDQDSFNSSQQSLFSTMEMASSFDPSLSNNFMDYKNDDVNVDYTEDINRYNDEEEEEDDIKIFQSLGLLQTVEEPRPEEKVENLTRIQTQFQQLYNLAIIYLACRWLKLPVMISDIYR